MKLTRVLAGYTIVEVLIVLAVTGALFAAAMSLIGGQQQKTEFSQNARELESLIQDAMNDVSSGYYTKNINLSCNKTATGPAIIASASDTQGSNEACIYIGRVLVFTTGSSFSRHTLVGLRQITAGSVTRDTANVVEAQPRTIAPASALDTTPNGTDQLPLRAGHFVRWIRYNNGTTQNIGAFAVVGELASFDTAGTLQSQARKRVNLVPIIGSALNNDAFTAATRINNIKNQVDGNNQPVDMNPAAGIQICMDNGKQNAIITIGGTDRPLGTDLVINSGVCPA